MNEKRGFAGAAGLCGLGVPGLLTIPLAHSQAHELAHDPAYHQQHGEAEVEPLTLRARAPGGPAHHEEHDDQNGEQNEQEEDTVAGGDASLDAV